MSTSSLFPGRYRGSKLSRTTYAVNHIFKFCLQIGSENLFPSETKSENMDEINQTELRPRFMISDPVVLPGIVL
jgi:hypothetical protein